jgi:hypothetical protein
LISNGKSNDLLSPINWNPLPPYLSLIASTYDGSDIPQVHISPTSASKQALLETVFPPQEAGRRLNLEKNQVRNVCGLRHTSPPQGEGVLF